MQEDCFYLNIKVRRQMIHSLDEKNPQLTDTGTGVGRRPVGIGTAYLVSNKKSLLEKHFPRGITREWGLGTKMPRISGVWVLECRAWI